MSLKSIPQGWTEGRKSVLQDVPSGPARRTQASGGRTGLTLPKWEFLTCERKREGGSETGESERGRMENKNDWREQ